MNIDEPIEEQNVSEEVKLYCNYALEIQAVAASVAAMG
jgi:hypothetical protein